MDVVTAISGSGPAYYFLLTETLAKAGKQLGLSPEIADKLAACTASGAGSMIKQGSQDPVELRQSVTSPGGTTQAALEVLQAGQFESLVTAAVQAAADRSRKL